MIALTTSVTKSRKIASKLRGRVRPVSCLNLLLCADLFKGSKPRLGITFLCVSDVITATLWGTTLQVVWFATEYPVQSTGLLGMFAAVEFQPHF